jgi:VWFA-related protein
MTTIRGIAAVLVLAGASLYAQRPLPAPASPTFTLAVDYIEVDALVTDRQGNLLHGLTKDDFQLREDGKPQAISAFSVVDIPAMAPQSPLSARAVIAPDVASNTEPFAGRIYVAVIDDFHTPPDQTQRLKAAAQRFVQEDFGANDLMAVVHTVGSTEANQTFTSDKQLLLAAIDKTNGRDPGSPALQVYDYGQRSIRGEDPYTVDAEQAAAARATLDTLQDVAGRLANVRNRRKAILFFSDGIDYNVVSMVPNAAATALRNIDPGASAPSNEFATAVLAAMHAAIDAATRNNVAIYGIDSRGGSNNRGDLDILEMSSHPSLANEVRLAHDSLRTLSEGTGGFAVVDQNDFDGAYRRIVAENSAYYVLAYYPQAARHDGKFHKIDVRVNRPGVTVRARRGYTAPKERTERAGSEAEASAELHAALSSPIPAAGLTMRVFAAPFRGVGPDSSVLLGTELRGDDLRLAGADQINVSYVAIDASGKPHDAETYTVTLNLDSATRVRIEKSGLRLLKRLSLPAGSYELRVAAHDSAGGRAGSVHYRLEVPDFGQTPLVLSGVVLTSALGAFTPTPYPDEALRSVLPAPPVALRQFPQNDTFVVYCEAYDNEAFIPHRVDLTMAATADDGRVRFKTAEVHDVAELNGKPGRYAFAVRVPMRDLPIGSYVLTVRAQSTIGQQPPATRQIPFTVTAPVNLPAVQ